MMREWMYVRDMLRDRRFSERAGFYLLALRGVITGKIPGLDDRASAEIDDRAREIVGVPEGWQFNPATEEEMDALYDEIAEYRRKRVNEIYDSAMPHKHVAAMKVVMASENLDVEFMKTAKTWVDENGRLIIAPKDET